MKKKLLFFIIFFSLNSFSQDFYKSSSVKERYGYSINELKKWGFNNRFSYNIEDLKKYKDSIHILYKIKYVLVSLKQQVHINEVLTDLEKLPNLKNIKFESSSFLRKEVKQKEFPQKFETLKKLETIILSGNPNWELNELFLEFSKIKNLKNISFISFSDSIFLNKNFLKNKNIEGIKFQARFGPKFPANFEQLKKLKTFILQVDTYSNAKEEFSKVKNLENLLVSIYQPKNDEMSSILNNYTSLKRLTINGKIKSSNQLFASIGKNDKLEILSIGNNDLNEIPKEIGSLNNLKSFYSSNNKFRKELPKEFYNLTTLKNIEIEGSNLEIISGDINKLEKLESLKLYFNKIKTLPEKVNGLSNLKKLYLNHNQIKKLPKDIGQLDLSYLSLNNNSLQGLPNSITNFKNLDTLNLEENYIKELPKRIGNLEKLKYLNLELNNLILLPNSLSKLDKLEYLNLSRNKITKLPINFGELTSLKKLDAEFCLLKNLPKSFGNLKSLEKLVLTNNNLQSLPENFGKLKNLKKLYLYNRKNYDYVYNRYYKKDSTIDLKVLDNNITVLPTSFSDLPQLEFIELSFNKNINENQLFTVLKKSKFKNYKINLEKCNIKKLPVSGWSFIKVSSLDLRDNLITKIPKDIINAKYLKTLNLNRNKSINTFRQNKTQLALLYVEKGFIKEENLHKTDELVIAYAKTANRKINNKEYKKGVEYAEKAFELNKKLTHKHLYEDNYIEALFYTKDYLKSISYANTEIKKDTSKRIRMLNSIIPNFNYKAKSQLALGDTIKAIKTFKLVSEKFGGNKWMQAGLLSKKIKKDSLSKKFFKESYNFYNSYIKNNPKAWGYHFSLVEAYIIGNEINLAAEHIIKIKKSNINNKNYKFLIPYFENILQILKEDNFIPDFIDFKTNLKNNNIKLNSWSFKLLENWVALSELDEEKKERIIRLNNLFK